MPDNTDCPAITIEEMPPTDFSLHMDPSKIPIAIKNSDVTKLISIANTILTLNIEGSIERDGEFSHL